MLLVGATACFLAAQVLAATPPTAVSGDPDGAYGITITKIEVSKDNGASYTTRFEGTCDVNLATTAAGLAVARLGDDLVLPPGTYTRVRVTLGPLLYLKGCVNYNGATFFTNGGADEHGYEANVAGLNAPGDTYAVSTFTIPEPSRTFEQAIALSVGAAPPAVSVAFDLHGVITQTGGNPSVRAPVVTITEASAS